MEKFSLLKFLFFKGGRVNRKIYFAITVYFVIFSTFIQLIEYKTFGTTIIVPYKIALIANIPLLYLNTIFMIKRSHDINKSGWFVLWMLVPFVNFWLIFYLYFKKGIDENNRFGENPERIEKNIILPISLKVTIPIFLILVMINIGIFVRLGGGFVGIKIDMYISTLKNTTLFPVKISDGLELSSVERDNKTLQYYYRFTNKEKKDLKKIDKASLKKRISKKLCKETFAKEIFEDGGKYRVIYNDKFNKEITSIEIISNDCQ